MRYFIQLSYHGADFHGWQIQPNAISVQEELIRGLSTLLKHNIQMTGCGRTDTGVHASYYIAHFDSDADFDTEFLVFKLNKFIYRRIAIHRIWSVPDGANARFDATYRLYHYFIHTKKSPFIADQSYYYSAPLNISAMNSASEKLCNYEDFTSFSKVNTEVKTNICNVTKAVWEIEGDKLIFSIQANRFLRNMVRAIVGTLIDVGKGKTSVERFSDIIELKDRSKAGTSAPAHGLFLADVGYPEHLLPTGKMQSYQQQ